MIFFEKNTLTFFKNLRKNNNREWFNGNKDKYVAHVKEPFERFVGHMIGEMHRINPKVAIQPKDAIFRIYRDTRFSKDKTPYKEHTSAVISQGGRKDMTTPGLYIQMNDLDFRMYSGMYSPDKQQLQKIREAIARDPKGFKKLYSRKTFKDSFGEIRGEKNKRLPKEFVDAAEVEPLIFNKGFYFFAKLDPKVVLDKNLPKTIMKHWKIAQPLNDFFQDAIQ